MKTRNIALIAVFTALMAVLSPIAIPMAGGVDISLATLAVMFIALVIEEKSLAVVLLYIVLAFIGVPVLAGFASGPAILFGKTGGYIFGYLFLALFTFIASKMAVKYNGFLSYVIMFIGMLMGTIVLYAFGTAWFMFITEIPLGLSLTYCVIPFIPGDLLKMIIVLIIGPRIKKIIEKSN